MVADDLSLTAGNLINNGILQGNCTLQFDTGALSNLSHGQIVSAGLLNLTPPQLTNAGLVLADDFILSTERLENTGTLQGTAVWLSASPR